jgi:Pyridoxal-dependent decarboxylase, pyridoxal binding domain
MIALSLDHIRHRGALAAWLERDGQPDAKSRALVDETVALRRCALYCNVFKGTAVSYPAAFLGFGALTEWIRRHRVTVDVSTAGELDRAMAVGIDPARIVMHPNRAAACIRGAVDAGAARFVVSSRQQIAILADSADRIQRVVIDPTGDATDSLVSEVVAHPELDLIGLHYRLDASDDAIGAIGLRRVVAEMARTRREHAILLTRISVAGLDIGECGLEPRLLRRVAEAIGEVIDDACAQYRYPRPALTLAPARSVLLPAGQSGRALLERELMRELSR